MKNFTFHNPVKILFGTNRESEFAQEVKKLGARALIVTGGGSVKKNGIFSAVTQALEAEGVSYVEKTGISPNPRIDEAEDGIHIARENKVEVILAIGGGSTIDAAKLIAAATLSDANPWAIVTKKVRVSKALPLAVVLTLSATGSEMDSNSVIQNQETEEKQGWESPAVYPRVTLENPATTTSVNAWHTAAGTADIMSHTIEQYFAPGDGALLTDTLAEGILETCLHYGPIAVKHPDDLVARGNLMWASSLALNGLLSTGKGTPWSVHDMEHELSAKYDITHGVGLAILTPHWMRHVLDADSTPRFARFAKRLFGIEREDLRAQAEAGIDALYDFFLSLGIPMTLREVGIGAERLEEMAEAICAYRGGAIRGYRTLEKEDIVAIYRAAL